MMCPVNAPCDDADATPCPCACPPWPKASGRLEQAAMKRIAKAIPVRRECVIGGLLPTCTQRYSKPSLLETRRNGRAHLQPRWAVVKSRWDDRPSTGAAMRSRWEVLSPGVAVLPSASEALPPDVAV